MTKMLNFTLVVRKGCRAPLIVGQKLTRNLKIDFPHALLLKSYMHDLYLTCLVYCMCVTFFVQKIYNGYKITIEL